MQDRVPLYPGRVQLTPVSGNIYDMTMADQPQQQGTPLNKASLLKDATAALFGLTGTAVPDDVLAWIGKYNEYFWRRRSISFAEVRTDINIDVNVTSVNSSRVLQVSSGITFDSSGQVVLLNPSEYTVARTGAGATSLAQLAPVYITNLVGESSAIYYLPSGSSGGSGSSGLTVAYTSSQVKLMSNAPTKAKQITSETNYGEWEYVYSSDRNAYPDSGIVDGYEYEYIGVPFDTLFNAAKVYIGSWIGDGTAPRYISLPWEPKYVLILGHFYSSGVKAQIAWLVSGITYFADAEGYLGYGNQSKVAKIDGASIKIQNKDWQNCSGQTVYYVAFR